MPDTGEGYLGWLARCCWWSTGEMLTCARKAGFGTICASIAGPDRSLSERAAAVCRTSKTGHMPASNAKCTAQLSENDALALLQRVVVTTLT